MADHDDGEIVLDDVALNGDEGDEAAVHAAAGGVVDQEGGVAADPVVNVDEGAAAGFGGLANFHQGVGDAGADVVVDLDVVDEQGGVAADDADPVVIADQGAFFDGFWDFDEEGGFFDGLWDFDEEGPSNERRVIAKRDHDLDQNPQLPPPQQQQQAAEDAIYTAFAESAALIAAEDQDAAIANAFADLKAKAAIAEEAAAADAALAAAREEQRRIALDQLQLPAPIHNMGASPPGQYVYQLCRKKLTRPDLETNLAITGKNRGFLTQAANAAGIVFPNEVSVQVINGHPPGNVNLNRRQGDYFDLVWGSMSRSQGFPLARNQWVSIWFQIVVEGLNSSMIVYIRGD